MSTRSAQHDGAPLLTYLKRVPAVEGEIDFGGSEEGLWWAKFVIKVEHPLAWRVVQELGYVLNYVSLEEPLPTVLRFPKLKVGLRKNGGCSVPVKASTFPDGRS